jgi:hypothetical protein
MTDLSTLESLARAVHAADDRGDGHQTALASDAFHAAANPAAILELVERVRQAEAAVAHLITAKGAIAALDRAVDDGYCRHCGELNCRSVCVRDE